jgi:hypothetical protein
MPPDRKDIIRQMFQALENPHKDLTEWEENFLESISDQFEKRGTLSDKQFEILDRIYAEKTP